MRLSVVVPFYKRIEDFRRVLPLNQRYLAREDVEVVLVLDEPTEEHAVLDVVRTAAGIRFRVLVNDREHAWRTPCCAINVGVRHAAGDHVLVVSPESAFVGDVPAEVLAVQDAEPGCAVLGRVAFATFDELARRGSVETAFTESELDPPIYFGSVCAPRSVFRVLRGYDERISEWGGDDDNIRIRMAMIGTPIFRDEDLRILHLGSQPRGARNPHHARPAEPQLKAALRPASAFVNPNGWGREFDRVAFDWARAST
jgi:hypothetical protein